MGLFHIAPEIRDVNETRDSKEFLDIENFISRHREFETAGLHVIFTIV